MEMSRDGANARPASDDRQLLTFALGEESYGLEILSVREIKGLSPVTPIPGAPPHVRGVMNLRGAVIPVVDLRAKLGLAGGAYDRFTVIVVVSVGDRTVGLVVDSVSDVLAVAPADVETVPGVVSGDGTRAIAGVAKVGERLVTLLDLDRMLGDEVATPGAGR